MCSSIVKLVVFSFDPFVGVKTFNLSFSFYLLTMISKNTCPTKQCGSHTTRGGDKETVWNRHSSGTLRPCAFSYGKRRLRTKMCARAREIGSRLFRARQSVFSYDTVIISSVATHILQTLVYDNPPVVVRPSDTGQLICGTSVLLEWYASL